MQPPYHFDAHKLAALRNSVSADRLGRYEKTVGGDTARALQLYMWNTALSEALYGPVQGLEVTLRNKIHDRLATDFGPNWYDNRRLALRHVQDEQITRAKHSLRQQGKKPEPSRMVAELNLGFWVGLFGNAYETHLWRPHLRKLFVNAGTPFLRKEAHKALNDIRVLRNRIAHHEPIFGRPLALEYRLVLTVIGWLCEDTADWVNRHSRFEVVRSARP